jgi:hypothetical protein
LQGTPTRPIDARMNKLPAEDHMGIDELKKLGSEIREDLRHTGADARKQWKHVLEPQLAHVETLAKDVSTASHNLVARTAAAFRAFQASIKSSGKISPPPRRRRRAPAKRTH